MRAGNKFGFFSGMGVEKREKTRRRGEAVSGKEEEQVGWKEEKKLTAILDTVFHVQYFLRHWMRSSRASG
jgi:hypothetical protein